MAQIIKPNQVKILTNDNEVKVSITLDLNISLNGDNINISSNVAAVKKNEVKEEKVSWEIPDFGITPLIEFGKSE